jgi:hypothetical protein
VYEVQVPAEKIAAAQALAQPVARPLTQEEVEQLGVTALPGFRYFLHACDLAQRPPLPTD